MTGNELSRKTIEHDLKHNINTVHPRYKDKLLQEFKRITGKDWEDDK